MIPMRETRYDEDGNPLYDYIEAADEAYEGEVDPDADHVDEWPDDWPDPDVFIDHFMKIDHDPEFMKHLREI